MESSEPKWVNPVLNTVGVNSFRLGGLKIVCQEIIYYLFINQPKYK